MVCLGEGKELEVRPWIIMFWESFSNFNWEFKSYSLGSRLEDTHNRVTAGHMHIFEKFIFPKFLALYKVFSQHIQLNIYFILDDAMLLQNLIFYHYWFIQKSFHKFHESRKRMQWKKLSLYRNIWEILLYSWMI